MADHRFIRTKIWSDEWFAGLSHEARYLYLYLLSNKNTHICGYYELSIKEISFFTGIQQRKVQECLKELEPNVYYIDSWVVIKNYAKHQNVANNVKVQVLIEKELKNVPEHVLSLSHKSKSKSEAIDSLSIGYEEKAKNKDDVDKPVDKDKKKYGEFKNVLLTDEEKEKLKERYGRDVALGLVEELSTGIESKGYKYKSHYATILSWARKKGVQVVSSGKEPKLIPEMQPNGTVRLVANPNYHD